MPVVFGLFAISVAILALQVLQTRILSVQMWHHQTYMVVTMTLLGFAAAGSLVTVWPALVRNASRTLPWCGTLFAVTTIVGYLVLSRTADRAVEMTAQGQYFALSVFYSYLLIPYLFGGLVITIALSTAKNIHRLYSVNLIGSAVGAWVFIGTITALGAERLLVLCAAAGPLASLSFLRKTGTATAPPSRASDLIGAWVALLACAGLFVQGPSWLKIKVSTTKVESITLSNFENAKFLEEYWTPLCRLDLVEVLGPDGEKGVINIYQDGDAITVMLSDDEFAKVSDFAVNTVAYVPHYLRIQAGEPGPKALAIGIGGGIDIRHALRQGARSIIGIEINGTTVDLVGRKYREFNDDIYHRPGVQVVVGEGRSTLRRLDETFDVIQLSGTDTYTASNSGAYVLSESFLYTSEALRDYLEHLTPHGTLGFIRLGYDPPRENLRLFAIALTQLRDMGVEHPSQHAVVIYEETHSDAMNDVIRFGSSVFSREPFEQPAIDLYKLADNDPYRLAYYPGMAAEGKENEFTRLAAAIDSGTEEAFYADYPWNIRPVTDDSPFFFNFHTLSSVWTGDRAAKNTQYYELAGGAVGMEMLGSLLLQAVVLVALLVILPLLILRRNGLRSSNAGRHLFYFLALGAAFMFLEISTIQRLVLFLGHPTYSLTVTLCCFLLFAGLGSLYSRRFMDRPVRALRRIVVALAMLICVLAFGLDLVLDQFLYLPLFGRISVVIVVLAPMNFLMGMPFPIGLARLKELSPQLVPWALGANGGAGVIASVLCIAIAMESGFRSVSLLAMAIYLVGMWPVTSGPLTEESTATGAIAAGPGACRAGSTSPGDR